jgi:hypothetical protein
MSCERNLTGYLENPFVPVTGNGERFENTLDLILPARFKGYVDERVAQADAVVSAIELQFDDVGVVGGDDPGELME